MPGAPGYTSDARAAAAAARHKCATRAGSQKWQCEETRTEGTRLDNNILYLLKLCGERRGASTAQTAPARWRTSPAACLSRHRSTSRRSTRRACCEWDDARAMHAAMNDALQPFMYLLESHDGCKRLFEAIDKLVPMTNMTALPTRAGVSAAGAVSRHHRRALRRTGPPLPPQ